MIALPGDLVRVKLTSRMFETRFTFGLLISRVTDHAMHEEDDEDHCIVIFVNSVKRVKCLGKDLQVWTCKT